MGVAMALAAPGSSLLIVLLKASAPIVATSLARAAGVNNPIILGLIGLATGLAMNGAKLGDWLKAGAKFGAEQVILPRLPYGLGMAYALADFAIANSPSPDETGDPGQADAVDALVQAQDAARENPNFQPTATATHCSEATAAIAEAVGAPTGPLEALSANEQARALAGSTEYREVTGAQAQALANQGEFAVVAYENPSGRGHTATVRPQGVSGDLPPVGGRGPLLNNIGRSMGVMNENWAFRRGMELHYYVPRH